MERTERSGRLGRHPSGSIGLYHHHQNSLQNRRPTEASAPSGTTIITPTSTQTVRHPGGQPATPGSMDDYVYVHDLVYPTTFVSAPMETVGAVGTTGPALTMAGTEMGLSAAVSLMGTVNTAGYWHDPAGLSALATGRTPNIGLHPVAPFAHHDPSQTLLALRPAPQLVPFSARPDPTVQPAQFQVEQGPGSVSQPVSMMQPLSMPQPLQMSQPLTDVALSSMVMPMSMPTLGASSVSMTLPEELSMPLSIELPMRLPLEMQLEAQMQSRSSLEMRTQTQLPVLSQIELPTELQMELPGVVTTRDGRSSSSFGPVHDLPLLADSLTLGEPSSSSDFDPIGLATHGEDPLFYDAEYPIENLNGIPDHGPMRRTAPIELGDISGHGSAIIVHQSASNSESFSSHMLTAAGLGSLTFDDRFASFGPSPPANTDVGWLGGRTVQSPTSSHSAQSADSSWTNVSRPGQQTPTSGLGSISSSRSLASSGLDEQVSPQSTNNLSQSSSSPDNGFSRARPFSSANSIGSYEELPFPMSSPESEGFIDVGHSALMAVQAMTNAQSLSPSSLGIVGYDMPTQMQMPLSMQMSMQMSVPMQMSMPMQMPMSMPAQMSSGLAMHAPIQMPGPAGAPLVRTAEPAPAPVLVSTPTEAFASSITDSTDYGPLASDQRNESVVADPVTTPPSASRRRKNVARAAVSKRRQSTQSGSSAASTSAHAHSHSHGHVHGPGPAPAAPCVSTSPPEKRVGRRRGPLRPEQRQQAHEIRKLRACLRCKYLKKTCDTGDPCAGCQPTHARLWQVPCTRVDIRDLGFFLVGWSVDYDRGPFAEFPYELIQSFSEVERDVKVSHGYGAYMGLSARKVDIVGHQENAFDINWVETGESSSQSEFKMSTGHLCLGLQGISSRVVHGYLESILTEELFDDWVDRYFDGTAFLSEILKSIHVYYLKTNVPALKTGLKMMIAYALTCHPTVITGLSDEDMAAGMFRDPGYRLFGQTIAPVLINIQVKKAFADMWRTLMKDVLSQLSTLFASVYSGDRLKHWPTIFMLTVLILAVWELILFDANYRMTNREDITKFVRAMEGTPVGVLIGLFAAISNQMPSFFDWDASKHGQVVHSDDDLCKVLNDTRGLVEKYEFYLRARPQTKFDRYNFDCLSNKFLSRLVIRA